MNIKPVFWIVEPDKGTIIAHIQNIWPELANDVHDLALSFNATTFFGECIGGVQSIKINTNQNENDEIALWCDLFDFLATTHTPHDLDHLWS